MPLVSLSQQHYQALEYVLRGLTNHQIAQLMNWSDNHTSLVLGSPCFQHELALRRAQLKELSNQEIVHSEQDVAAEVRRHTLAAAQKLGAIVGGKVAEAKPSDVIRAAEAILDRGGLPRVQRNESKGTVLLINAADLAILKETIQLVEEAGSNEPVD